MTYNLLTDHPDGDVLVSLERWALGSFLEHGIWSE